MAARRKWWLASLVYALIAVIIGFGVASATNSLLALSLSDKEVAAKAVLPDPTPIAQQSPPRSNPSGCRPATRMTPARHGCRATAGCGCVEHGRRPSVREAEGDFIVRRDTELETRGLSFERQRVDGAGREGMANGLLAAADAIGAGAALPDLTGAAIVPDLEYRFADFGAVGVTPDPRAWATQDDYSQLESVRRRHPGRTALRRPCGSC